MLKRELVDELRARKNSMISSLWANPSWDGEEADRPGVIEQIEEDFDRAVSQVYGSPVEDDGEEIDWEDPFFAAAKRGMDKIQVPESDHADNISVEEMQEAEKNAKAAAEYWAAMADVDQMG